MIKGFKIKLHPTPEQKILILKSFGTSRWVYNWALNRQKQNYEAEGKFISASSLKKEITKLKRQEEFIWLNEVSAKIPAQAIIDLCNAYIRFFSRKAKYPKFKCKKDNKDSFFQREDHFKINGKKVLLEKIGYVTMAENIILNGIEVKYLNPRVKYDGISIWLTFAVEVGDIQTNKERTEPVGIDLGLKTLAVCSNGKTFKKPNINKYIKRLKQLQSRTNKIYSQMESKNISCKSKSKRLIKLEKQILKTHHRITNILEDNIHQMTAEIVKANPAAVVIEDINIRELLKNKYISHNLMYSKFGEIIRQLKYKCAWNNIELIVADKWFASSKICSFCGQKKENLFLSQRVFVCEKCGSSIDRDLNAAINLKKLAV